jgi:hypothetical protein
LIFLISIKLFNLKTKREGYMVTLLNGPGIRDAILKRGTKAT